MCDRSLIDFDPMVILKVTSILKRLKEDMGPPYNITRVLLK